MDSHNAKPETTEATKSTSKELKNTFPAKNLLVRYSWLFFLSFLAIPLGVGILSYYQLIYVGYVPQIEPEKSAEVVSEEPITTSSNHSNPTPLWLMLAIALSCASGCWIIFRLLKLPQRV
ncbi:hypothetical protein [Anabaena sp. UHCC 0451]|uniref:hypothetical protein n=1 Tax=Anabaena sp. UHCC 0451 TaxID=2055235 RepID=UPI002B1EEFCF|nr:hypothetical protein [Anabaena sp. UHCC 0451]MEA5578074.1 hypothetical protein [Anabaena sp. UHCC 0451]